MLTGAEIRRNNKQAMIEFLIVQKHLSKFQRMQCMKKIWVTQRTPEIPQNKFHDNHN